MFITGLGCRSVGSMSLSTRTTRSSIPNPQNLSGVPPCLRNASTQKRRIRIQSRPQLPGLFEVSLGSRSSHLTQRNQKPEMEICACVWIPIWRVPEPEDERPGILAKAGLRAWHNVYGDKSGSGATGRKVRTEEVAALKHQVPQDHSLHCGFS